MRILLVARDTAPSQAFTEIELALKKNNVEVVPVLKDDSTVEKVMPTIGRCRPDMVLSGFSSSPDLAAGELSACLWAIANQIPVALFADTFRAWGREWFGPIRPLAKLLFVVNEDDAAMAQPLFAHAKIIASGNPAWKKKFSPAFSREEIRKQLGVSETKTLILCPGGKDLLVNLLHWTAVLAAARLLDLIRRHPAIIVFSLHPGDKNPRIYYRTLVAASRISSLIVESLQLTGDDMVAGADIVISSASSVGDVTAPCQRKPVINFFTAPALERLEKASGSRTLPSCDIYRVTEKVVEDPWKLAIRINELLTNTIDLRPQQEKIYPCPVEESAKLIAQTLISFPSG